MKYLIISTLPGSWRAVSHREERELEDQNHHSNLTESSDGLADDTTNSIKLESNLGMNRNVGVHKLGHVVDNAKNTSKPENLRPQFII